MMPNHKRDSIEKLDFFSVPIVDEQWSDIERWHTASTGVREITTKTTYDIGNKMKHIVSKSEVEEELFSFRFYGHLALNLLFSKFPFLAFPALLLFVIAIFDFGFFLLGENRGEISLIISGIVFLLVSLPFGWFALWKYFEIYFKLWDERLVYLQRKKIAEVRGSDKKYKIVDIKDWDDFHKNLRTGTI